MDMGWILVILIISAILFGALILGVWGIMYTIRNGMNEIIRALESIDKRLENLAGK